VYCLASVVAVIQHVKLAQGCIAVAHRNVVGDELGGGIFAQKEMPQAFKDEAEALAVAVVV